MKGNVATESSANRRVFEPDVMKLRALIKALHEVNTQLVKADRSDVNSVNHRYQDLINPLVEMLNADFNNEVVAALDAVKALYEYNTTRAAVVEAMNKLIAVLQHYVDQHTRETVFQAIRDAFAFFDSTTDAASFLAEVVGVASNAYTDFAAKQDK